MIGSIVCNKNKHWDVLLFVLSAYVTCNTVIVWSSDNAEKKQLPSQVTQVVVDTFPEPCIREIPASDMEAKWEGYGENGAQIISVLLLKPVQTTIQISISSEEFVEGNCQNKSKDHKKGTMTMPMTVFTDNKYSQIGFFTRDETGKIKYVYCVNKAHHVQQMSMSDRFKDGMPNGSFNMTFDYKPLKYLFDDPRYFDTSGNYDKKIIVLHDISRKVVTVIWGGHISYNESLDVCTLNLRMAGQDNNDATANGDDEKPSN